MCVPAYRTRSDPGTELRSVDPSVLFSVTPLSLIAAFFSPVRGWLSPHPGHFHASWLGLSFLIEEELNVCCHGRRGVPWRSHCGTDSTLWRNLSDLKAAVPNAFLAFQPSEHRVP